MNSHDLLQAEYEHFSESLWRNEEIGERRVSYFVSLITAVLAALASLVASGVINFSIPGVRMVVIGLLSVLLVLGGITYLRMIHRNKVTDEYIGVLNYIRGRVLKDMTEGDGYELPLNNSSSWLLKGGLAETVAAMNGLIAGSIAFAILEGRNLVGISEESAETPLTGGGTLANTIPDMDTTSILCVVITTVAVWIGLAIPIIDRNRKKANKKQKTAQLTDLVFRAGVGAVVLNDSGMILAFERKGYPDSWQLPQGGIETDENPLYSIYREVKEETGIDKKSLELIRDTPLLTAYELPVKYRSSKTGRGQAHYWFVFRFTGDDAEITLGDNQEFSAHSWMRRDQILLKVIDFRREVYRQVFDHYSDLIR